MTTIASEIRVVDREHSLGIQPVAAGASDRIREHVLARYVRAGLTGARIWESSEEAASVHNRDAWGWVSEFVDSRSCVLLFDAVEEEEMFDVPSGRALERLLANSHGFEFYVTDREVSYLICFNHHDVLICWGSAKDWLENRLGRSPNGYRRSPR